MTPVPHSLILALLRGSAFVYLVANDVFCRNMDSKSNIKLAYV